MTREMTARSQFPDVILPTSAAEARSRARTRLATRAAIAVMVTIVLVLLFLLAQATSNREFFEHYYQRLFAINVAVATLLLVIIIWGVYRLIERLARRKFGSHLLIKLAAIFTLVGVAPGLLIYVVSYQFVSRSIESWFDVKVAGALQSGLLLARTSLETQANDLGNQLSATAPTLADIPEGMAPQSLSRLREQLGASDASLWSLDGSLIASSGLSRFDLTPARPPSNMLRSLRLQGAVTQLEGIDDPSESSTPLIRAIARVPPGGASLRLTKGGERIIEVVQPLPMNLVRAAVAVQQANREYQERALGRESLRRMYIGTLTLTLFLAVFGAVLLAVALGKQLARPLLMLAEWMAQVAAGDLRPKRSLAGRDELVGLTRSFAAMTEQLAEARAAVETRTGEVESARASLQTILDNLTTGVIVLDADGIVRSVNSGATRILGQNMSSYQHQPLSALPGLETFAADVQDLFASLAPDADQEIKEHWQKTFELYANPGQTGGAAPNVGKGEVVHVIARGARLPWGRRLLVFDDISEIVSAQRSLAWGEVARRLAHEIKNPLTPIQLSAERLERKLSGKLAPADQAVLAKSVQTIVDQVDAMKRLVNEFRDYARLPTAQLKLLDLNTLIDEVLLLYPQDGDVGGGGARQIQFAPDRQCPAIMGDAQQLRQVIHNLVQNALDASENVTTSTQGPKVLIETMFDQSKGLVQLRILDHGHGFSDAILRRAFEPYVTTKAKGTGLGLAVVKKIAQEHRAQLVVANRVSNGQIVGAQVLLSFCVSKQSISANSIDGAATPTGLAEAVTGAH